MNTTQPQVTVKQSLRNSCTIYVVRRLVNYTELRIGEELSTKDLDLLMHKRVNVIIN